MKHCLVLASSPDIFEYPEDFSYEESILRERLRTCLLEIYANACSFSLGLRNLTEIRMGELLVSIKDDYKYTDLIHIFPRKGYHNCRTEDEYEELLHVSEWCDHHFRISNEDKPDVTRTFCDFCENHTDLLFLVSPFDHIDPETEAIVNTAARTCKPILRFDPATLELRREHFLPDWLTYEKWVEQERRLYYNVASKPKIIRNRNTSQNKVK